MATHGVSFESSSNIEERKEKKRQARQEAIDKAKQQYEKEERRKELKRLRGEDTWILPEVDQRLQQIEEEGSIKSKKKKEKKSKKKKEKKKKVKKEKKAEEGNDSSESSQDSEEEWVEAQTQPAKAWKVPVQPKASEVDLSPAENIQRDEWMTFDFLAMKTTSTAERKAEKDRQKEEERAKAQAIEQAGVHKLELNPYCKDGGTGLPPEDITHTAAKKAGPVVNDGGLSWLRKSYQRMKEQAEREQRSLSDIVAQRYGSMEEFQKRLADAEKAVHGESRGNRESSAREGWRRGEEDDRERWRAREDDRQDRDRWRERERDLSPREKASYRRGEPKERDRGREDDRRRDGERERESRRDRGRDNEKDKNRDRERDRDRHREKEKDFGTQASSSSSGESWHQRSSSRGSLKAHFLKPSEDDDSVEARQRPPPTRPSVGFLKPSADDEDSLQKQSGIQAWKKHGTSGQEPDRTETPQENKIQPEGTGDTLHVASSARTENDSEEEEAEEEIPLLSEEEMNKLGSKLIKAEIMGNTVGSQSREDQDVLLFRTDESGRAWPVKGPSGPQEPHGGRRKKKPIETHVDGERVRYFQDDDNVGLKEMVRREKMSTAQDQHALYSRMAAKMMGKTDGDNYTLDDMFVSSAAQREGEGRDEDRMRNRAIGESRRLAVSMEKCAHCFSSQELPKHLIVAIGSKVYLSLPAGVSMTEGHCLICPLQHHTCATGLDEDVWSEMQLFRRALVRMFESQELDCVFMETYMNLRRKQHMVLECIPLPKELGDMAPIYFKKAIMECDEEWAMNKKLVDLSSKDIRRAVPQGLPYFAVDFGLQGGFAHVIENEQKFPHYFGKEVVGGMMDLEPRRWRKLIRENFDDQRKKVLQFAQWWKPYDCTKTEV
ncbi:CWF19-like protein 2 isoform X2 [Poeciliopsis prolifica]|uniref:CWF19-like protein 2 isoform X2 n=1 Tax=Poeciliopsis prolifica TaxID=188132 RepID=UPI00241359DA|nr:CWF19-like protein 2 isoform X2 [Poeciliopsis prolifica]